METLHASCFALPSAARYPMHTKEAALKSYSLYLKEQDSLSQAIRKEVETNFNKAAAYHGLNLEAIKEAKRLYLEKKAAAEAPKTITFTKNGVEVTMTKIATEEQLDAAIKNVLEKRASLPLEALKEPATYVFSVAEAFERDTDRPEMRKLAMIAGLGVGDQDEIERALLKRGSMIVIPNDAKADFYDMHQAIRKMTPDEFYKQATLDKICTFFDEMDRFYQLDRFYGKELERPEEVCYKSGVDDLLKEASDYFVIPSLDATLSKKALAEREEAANAFFREHFGASEKLTGEDLVVKVASLNQDEAKMFLDKVN